MEDRKGISGKEKLIHNYCGHLSVVELIECNTCNPLKRGIRKNDRGTERESSNNPNIRSGQD